MANPNPQDPYGGIQAFQSAIDPVQVAAQSAPAWSNGQQPSGWQGKTGGVAFLGTKLLEGITKGRVSAFAKQESDKAQTFDRMTKMLHMINEDPSIDPELKQSINKKYTVMLGRVGSQQVKDAAKGSKDENPARKHITGILGTVFDRMAGGPFKGDPLTVDHMSSFMGDVTEAISGKGKDSSAQSAFAKQNQLLQEGITEAQAAAKSGGRQTVSYEQVNNNPKVASALQWYAQYAPQQLSVVQQRFAGLPSENNPQQLARAELLSRATQPQQKPETQAPPSLRADAPPAERTALSANGTPVVPPGPPPARAGTPPPYLAAEGEHAGPPKPSPEEEHDRKMYDQLMIMSNYGPKPEHDVTYTDPESGIRATVAQSEFNAMMTQRKQGHTEANDADKKTDRATKSKQWEKKFTEQTAERTRSMNQRDRQLAQQDIAVGIRGAEYQLRATENDEKQAPQHAMSKLIKRATDAGTPFSDFADNVNQFLQHNEDPDIEEHAGYILDQVTRMKQRAKGGSYQEMMDMMTGKPPATPGAKPATAPPSARTAPADKAPKAGAAPVSRKASALGSKLGISLDGPAASSSAPDLSKLSDDDLFKQAAGSH